MPGFIPNEADAAFLDQAEPDAGDFDILANGGGSVGVVSGCAVTAQGTPDMTVAVASGRIVAGALPGVNVASGNLTIGAANATNPRFDLIAVNSSGTKSVIAGTASTNPVFPTIPAATVILAAVYVPANDTAINANQIRDKRVFVLEPAALSNATPLASGTAAPGSGIAASRDDHVHPAGGGGVVGATPVRLPTLTDWWGINGQAGARNNTYAHDDGRMFLAPVVFDRAVTLVALGTKVTNSPSAGAATRMVIYEGEVRPTNRLAHALLSAVTTGDQLATVNLALTAGKVYWVGMVNEGAAATRVGWQELTGEDIVTLPAPNFFGAGAKMWRYDITAGSTPPADLTATAPSTASTEAFKIMFDV